MILKNVTKQERDVKTSLSFYLLLDKVFRAFNIVSHKSYIGLTIRTIGKRWGKHIKYAQKDYGCDYNTVLSRAIRKYPYYTYI